MQGKKWFVAEIAIISVLAFTVTGCASLYKHGPTSKQRIKELEGAISDLKKQHDEERAHFENVKRMLEEKLKSEIANKDVSLEVGERGLVIVLSDNILFDPGKTIIKTEAETVLSELSAAVKNELPDKNIGVMGHTDDTPIKYSSWQSNWELSCARATTILHYLIDKGVAPQKLSATGYGEYKPLVPNTTDEGRAKNRRVEIIILPDFVEKKQEEMKEEVKALQTTELAEQAEESAIK